MPRVSSRSLAILGAVLLLLGACTRVPDEHVVVPPGVSLQPPPAAAKTGSLVLPGVTTPEVTPLDTTTGVLTPDTTGTPAATAPTDTTAAARQP